MAYDFGEYFRFISSQGANIIKSKMAKMALRTLTTQLLPKRPHHVHHLPRENASLDPSIGRDIRQYLQEITRNSLLSTVARTVTVSTIKYRFLLP